MKIEHVIVALTTIALISAVLGILYSLAWITAWAQYTAMQHFGFLG